MSSIKFDVEKFNRRIRFGLWQVQVKIWKDLDLKAASAIRLSLAKNVLANVQGISTAKELWRSLKECTKQKSLPPSYEHMKPILIHGKEKIVFSKVTDKFFFEEKRLSGGYSVPPKNSALVVAGSWKKNNSTNKKLVC
ncbi:hypothetical protein Patl1_07123 [Pistacia atlantica]|uniref:Uncharacterized protein n=1 Tax=Pistacia atlantica TaxID=434234 RepID=A0ACC1AEH9_9ROSI|nr:hypothetical protein Patl1_07123 [Pistacia atlantica]